MIWQAKRQEWHAGQLTLTLLKDKKDIDSLAQDLAGPFDEPDWAIPIKGEALPKDREDAAKEMACLPQKPSLKSLENPKKTKLETCIRWFCGSRPSRPPSRAARNNTLSGRHGSQSKMRTTPIRPLGDSGLWVQE